MAVLKESEPIEGETVSYNFILINVYHSNKTVLFFLY